MIFKSLEAVIAGIRLVATGGDIDFWALDVEWGREEEGRLPGY